MFDSHTQRRINRAVRAIENYPSNTATAQSQPGPRQGTYRWLPVRNTTNEIIPARAVM